MLLFLGGLLTLFSFTIIVYFSDSYTVKCMCDSFYFFFISCDWERKWAENNNNVLKYMTVEGKRQDVFDVTACRQTFFFFFLNIWNRQISSCRFSQGSMCMNSNQFCGLFERSWPEELPWEPNTFKDCFLLAFTKPIGTLMWLYPSSGECSTFSYTRTVIQIQTCCLPSFWEDAVTNSLPNAFKKKKKKSLPCLCVHLKISDHLHRNASRCCTNE